MNKNSKTVHRLARLQAKKNTGDVISSNQYRNMQMIVSHNTDSNGRKFSVTSHEAISNDRPITFKNHHYIEDYKQPSRFRAAGE